ncbi:MAG: DUF4924 family protein [Bacteroidales bacterium]|nr:DUF4924 family protein [Bacteroidales bacterium]
MIIAELKKKENIVEYILYIRQLMDIMRANNLDIQKIDELLVSKFEISEKEKLKIHNWYRDLIGKMKDENVEHSGDIQEIKDLIAILNKIHQTLLADKDEYRHHELYNWAKPNIEEYKKLSRSNSDNEIEICIDAMYALLLLKLQHKSISDETAQAMQTFGSLLANLAEAYKQLTMNNG